MDQMFASLFRFMIHPLKEGLHMVRRLLEEEGGFTLVELLVTISILAVLFGIVTLTLTGVGTDAENAVIEAECGVVQSAIDIFMADNNVATISAQASSGPVTSGADFAAYLRNLPTEYNYTWTADGTLTCDDVP
jgi:prepilin-type N-terminal cleavage/methylation domain-containing protein